MENHELNNEPINEESLSTIITRVFFSWGIIHRSIRQSKSLRAMIDRSVSWVLIARSINWLIIISKS